MTMPREDHQGWRKSSYSGSSGTGDCVEVALAVERVGVRDSKNAGGTRLVFLPDAWRTFVRSVA